MKLLTKEDIKLVAEKLNILPEVLFAIDKVESAGCGFYLDNGEFFQEIKVLMEGHYFSKFTNKKFDKSHPTLSYPKWIKGVTTKFYQKGQNEFKRFMSAIKLDKQAALLSTSFGRYQVCGFNHKKCGYDTVVEMVTEFYKSELNQLIGFIGYCENTFSKKYQKNLIELLQEYSQTKNVLLIKEFVRLYNGSGLIESYTSKILDNIKTYKK